MYSCAFFHINSQREKNRPFGKVWYIQLHRQQEQNVTSNDYEIVIRSMKSHGNLQPNDQQLYVPESIITCNINQNGQSWLTISHNHHSLTSDLSVFLSLLCHVTMVSTMVFNLPWYLTLVVFLLFSHQVCLKSLNFQVYFTS